MKKLLYLFPLVLLALCATHITLHKDTVTYSPGGGLTSLKPSHWKLRDYELNTSFSLPQAQAAGNQQSSASQSYSQNAQFNGFPFGFYFSNAKSSSISSYKVSAYSWLWAAVDGLIIILALLTAIFFNRPRRKPEPVPTNAPTTIDSVYPSPPLSNIYPPYPPANT